MKKQTCNKCGSSVLWTRHHPDSLFEKVEGSLVWGDRWYRRFLKPQTAYVRHVCKNACSAGEVCK
jgi:hypothetical protein